MPRSTGRSDCPFAARAKASEDRCTLFSDGGQSVYEARRSRDLMRQYRDAPVASLHAAMKIRDSATITTGAKSPALAPLFRALVYAEYALSANLESLSGLEDNVRLRGQRDG